MVKQFFNSQMIGGTYVITGSYNTDGFPAGSSYTPCCTSSSNIYDWEKQIGLISYDGLGAGVKNADFATMYLAEYDSVEECSSCDAAGDADDNINTYYDPRNFTCSIYSHDAFSFIASISYVFQNVNVVDFEFESSTVFGMAKYHIHGFQAYCTFPTGAEGELTQVIDNVDTMTLSEPSAIFKRCKRNYRSPINGEITITFVGCYHSKITMFRGIGINNYFKCINVGAYLPQVIEFRFSTGDFCMCQSEHITPIVYTSSKYAVDSATFIVHKYQYDDDDPTKLVPVIYKVFTESGFDPDPNNPQYNPYAYTPLEIGDFGTYTIELYMTNSEGNSDSLYFGYVSDIANATKFYITPEIEGSLDVLTTAIKVRDPYSVTFIEMAGWDVSLDSSVYTVSSSLIGSHFAYIAIGESHLIFSGDPSTSTLTFDYKSHGPEGLIIPGSCNGVFTYIERCNATKDYTTSVTIDYPYPDTSVTYTQEEFPSGVTKINFVIPAYDDAITYYYDFESGKYYHVHYTTSYTMNYGNGTSVTQDVTNEEGSYVIYCMYSPGDYFATYSAINPSFGSSNAIELNIGWDAIDVPGYWLLSYATSHNVKLELDEHMNHCVSDYSYVLPNGTNYVHLESATYDFSEYWSGYPNTYATFYFENPLEFSSNTVNVCDLEIITDVINKASIDNGPIYPLPSFTVFGSNLVGVNEVYLFPTFALVDSPETEAKASDLFPTESYRIDCEIVSLSDTELQCILIDPIPLDWHPYTGVELSTTGFSYFVHLANTTDKSMNHVMQLEITDNIPYITGCYFPPHYIRRGANVDSGGDTIWIQGRLNGTFATIYDINGSPIITGSSSFPTYVEGLGSVAAGSVMEINLITTADTPIGLITISVYNAFGSYSTEHLEDRTTIPFIYYNPVITSMTPSSIENGRTRYFSYAESGFSNEITVWGTDLHSSMILTSNVSGLSFEYPTKPQPNDGSHLYFDLTVTNTQNWNGSDISVYLKGTYSGYVTGDYSSTPVLTLVPPEKVDISDLTSTAILCSDAITYNGLYNEIVTINLYGEGFKLKETIDNIEYYITISTDTYGIYSINDLPYDPERDISVSYGLITFKIWVDPSIEKCTPVVFTVVNPDGAYTTYSYEVGKHRFMSGFEPVNLSYFSLTTGGGQFEFAEGDLVGSNMASFESIVCMRGGLNNSRGDLWNNLSVVSYTVTHGVKGNVYGTMTIKFILGSVGFISIRTSHCGASGSLDF